MLSSGRFRRPHPGAGRRPRVALLGIADELEFFNHRSATWMPGLPLGATGLDYWAGWLVQVFVRGRVLDDVLAAVRDGLRGDAGARATVAGRGFLWPYLRRIAGAGRVRRPAFSSRCGPATSSSATPPAPCLPGDRVRRQTAGAAVAGAWCCSCWRRRSAWRAPSGILPWQPMLSIGIPCCCSARWRTLFDAGRSRLAGRGPRAVPVAGVGDDARQRRDARTSAKRSGIRSAWPRRGPQSSARRSRPASRSAAAQRATHPGTSPTRPG